MGRATTGSVPRASASTAEISVLEALDYLVRLQPPHPKAGQMAVTTKGFTLEYAGHRIPLVLSGTGATTNAAGKTAR